MKEEKLKALRKSCDIPDWVGDEDARKSLDGSLVSALYDLGEEVREFKAAFVDGLPSFIRNRL